MIQGGPGRARAPSARDRLLRYLLSNKNLAGCAAGLGGLALWFTGVVGSAWPLVVAGLYAAAALAVPPQKVPVLSLGGGMDLADLDRVMAEQARRIAGKVPAEVPPAVQRIHQEVRDLLAREDGLTPGTPEAFIVRQTVLDYLPAALEGYLRLPRRYADNVALTGSGGRTARQLLGEQLALIETKLGEVTEAVVRGDADRLLAHGRFLADRFSTGGDLQLGDEG